MSEETGVSGTAGRRKGMGIEQAVKGVGKEQAAKKQAVKAEGEEQAAKKQVVKGKGMEEAGNRAGRERNRRGYDRSRESGRDRKGICALAVQNSRSGQQGPVKETGAGLDGAGDLQDGQRGRAGR